MGRPTLLDDLVTKRIVSAVEKGASREAAAGAARISRSTLQDWLRRGAEGEEPYAQFVERVLAAHGALHVEVSGHLLDLARNCEHPPTRLGALKLLLERLDRVETGTAASQNDGLDVGNDVQVLESLLAAAKSRTEAA